MPDQPGPAASEAPPRKRPLSDFRRGSLPLSDAIREADAVTEPTRYALDEARREMDRQECARHGHTWDVISNGGGVPVAIICSRCDSRYNVTPMRDTP